MEDPVGNRGTRRRRKRTRSFNRDSLRQWAKDDVPEGDPRDERNLGLVVAVAIGLFGLNSGAALVTVGYLLERD